MAVEFKMEGFEELFRKMDEIAEEVGKQKTDNIWRNILRDAMQPVLEMAKELAPGDSPEATGQLRNNIKLTVKRPNSGDKRSKYYNGESYMAMVYTSPIREESVKKYVLRKGGRLSSYWTNVRPVALSQEFGNKRLMNSEFGTAAKGAHPFLRPALESNIGRIQTRLGYSIMNVLEKYGK